MFEKFRRVLASMVWCALATLWAAGPSWAAEDFLPVKEAFEFSARVDPGQRLGLHWQIAKGYHL